MTESLEQADVAAPEVKEYVRSAYGSRVSVRAHAVSLLLIVVSVVAMFWRVFLLGETLVDVRTLNNQLPWGYHAGPSNYPYNRRDVTDMYVTRDYFLAAAYRDGELPLWNPYTMAGHPIYADGVTRIFSPFLLFYKIFDVPLGYSISRITELLLAAVFMYVFLVCTGNGPQGGLMGSLVLAFSAHSMLHLTGSGWWGGLMWLPLILMFVDRAAIKPRYRDAVLAGVFLALQFFCGYMPNQIYYVGAIVLYYLFFAVRRPASGGRLRSIGRALTMICATLSVGLALAATQWVPVIELLRQSNRKIVPVETSYIYLPPWYLATLVFPNLFGSAYDAKALSLYTALNVSHDHILYLGVPALLALGFLLYSRTGRRVNHRSEFFWLLAGVALLIAMAAPIYVHVTRFIPVLQSIRVTVRAAVLFVFAGSVLAAFGADALLKAGEQTLVAFSRRVRDFSFVVTGFVVVSVILSYAIKLGGVANDLSGRGRMAFIRRAANLFSSQFTPPNAAIVIPLALVVAVALLTRWSASRRVTPEVMVASLVVLLLGDLSWNSTQLNNTFDRSEVFPPTEITNALRSLPPGRVLVTPSDLGSNRRAAAGERPDKIIAPPNTLLAYRIPTVTGKDQLFPKRYREFASLIEPQPNLSHVVFDDSHSRYFDLLNVRYILTHASRPAPPGCDVLATAEGVTLYLNQAAMPRAFFVDQVIEVDGDASCLQALGDPRFDPRTMVVIQDSGGPGPDQWAISVTTPAAWAADIVEDKRNRVTIETNKPNDGLLVLSDNYYPGWEAYVDGAPTEVLRANYTMRAVRMPAGRHIVTFVFAPRSFWRSVYVSSIALAAVVILFFGCRRRR